MSELLDNRNGGEIQRIAGVALKGADTTLTENDLVIALGENVFGRHQPFLHGG